MSNEQMQYMHKLKTRKKLIRFVQIFILVVFVASWEVAGKIGMIDPFIFSSPTRVAKTFVKMTKDGSVFLHTWVTIYETIIGFGLGSVLGILFAILLWYNKTAYKIFEPYLVIFNSLPKTALAPILIVWIGNNIKSIVVIAVSLIIVITIFNIINAFNSIEDEKIKLILSFGGTKKDVLKKLILPASMPTIISVLKINIGLALIGVIIGEILVAKNGLGYLIVYGSQIFKLDWVMMSILLLAVLSALLYKSISILENKMKS